MNSRSTRTICYDSVQVRARVELQHIEIARDESLKRENERQLTDETYKVYRESRRTAGRVKRDLLFVVRKRVDGKRYQNIYFCDG